MWSREIDMSSQPHMKKMCDTLRDLMIAHDPNRLAIIKSLEDLNDEEIEVVAEIDNAVSDVSTIQVGGK